MTEILFNERSIDEHRRAQYLDAMGLDTYVPRWVLPNALAPVACELGVEVGVEELRVVDKPETEERVEYHSSALSSEAVTAGASESVGEEPAQPLSREQVSSLNEGLSSVLAELSGEAPKREPRKIEALPESVSEEEVLKSVDLSDVAVAQEKAKFNLGLWFTDTKIQILDSRKEGDALPTEVFLSNLLLGNALIQNRLPAMETQVWPFPGASEGEQGWVAACAMMSDFFQFRFEQSPATAIFAFGEEAARVILGADFNYQDACFSSVPSDDYGIPVTVLPSLRDFLYQPELKRKLWSALSNTRSAIAQ